MCEDRLHERYFEVRNFSERLCGPLTPEDCVIQSMPDVSPTRWHLAHTTWFFETFVLGQAHYDYRPFNPSFEHLFNSYYNSVGEQFPRPRRGLLSRPTLNEVLEYRREVDRQMNALFEQGALDDWADVIELGLHHEQQHQELMLTDIKHVFSCNPLFPAYREAQHEAGNEPPPLRFHDFPAKLDMIGHRGDGFAFDNEGPRHRVYVDEHEIAGRPVTNGEYLDFIEDGGYARHDLWLSLGWGFMQSEQWQAPLYWVRRDGQWMQFTLSGLAPLNLAAPVCHVSYFEADAYARWADARLPTEAEWELATAQRFPDSMEQANFVESGRLQPAPAPRGEGISQLLGDVWEWTSSSYSPYPAYRPPEGALGEYNGKFMCNQYVLRGGSCATSRTHIRKTYRNFFPPEARWQFSGIRLARSLAGEQH